MDSTDSERLEEIYRFFFVPPAPGRKPRAQELDEYFGRWRALELLARGVLWLAGFVAAISGAFVAVRGWFNV